MAQSKNSRLRGEFVSPLFIIDKIKHLRYGMKALRRPDGCSIVCNKRWGGKSEHPCVFQGVGAWHLRKEGGNKQRIQKVL